MRFGFDDEQLALRDALRGLLERECPPDVVRAAWSAPPGGADRRLWAHLEEMGVLSTLVPAEEGGLGLDERWLVLLLEETGRAGVPHPVVETAAVAGPLAGAGAATAPAGAVTATDLGGPNVAWAADADVLLLRDADRGHLHLLPAGAPGLVVEPVATVDGARRAGRIRWEPGRATLLVDDPDQVAGALDRGALGTAAQLLGLGQRMLDMTVAYVTERQQFGRPVGAFQAVKHHLADVLRELSFARPAVYRAAHSLAVGTAERARDVSMAKAMAADAAQLAGRRALQCHGAVGYTVEADLHLYLKRTWALARAWGDPAWHRARVARYVLEGEGA